MPLAYPPPCLGMLVHWSICLMGYLVDGRMNSFAKMNRKSITTCPYIVQKSFKNQLKNHPKSFKIGPERPPGPFSERLGLMGASWSGLGGLLERSWTALGPTKSPLDRLLAGPRGIPRQVSAILGAKRVPKGRPRGSKIEPKR